MADYLRNFIAGAAETGQKLYAEKAVMDRRAEIQSSRDARLASVQATRDQTQRQFQIDRDTTQNSFQLERDKVTATTREEEAKLTAQYRTDTLKLKQDELDYKTGDGANAAKFAPEIAWMIENGIAKDPQEAYELMNNPDKDTSINAVFSGLKEREKEIYGKDKRSMKEMYEEAVKIVMAPGKRAVVGDDGDTKPSAEQLPILEALQAGDITEAEARAKLEALGSNPL